MTKHNSRAAWHSQAEVAVQMNGMQTWATNYVMEMLGSLAYSTGDVFVAAQAQLS